MLREAGGGSWKVSARLIFAYFSARHIAWINFFLNVFLRDDFGFSRAFELRQRVIVCEKRSREWSDFVSGYLWTRHDTRKSRLCNAKATWLLLCAVSSNTIHIDDVIKSKINIGKRSLRVSEAFSSTQSESLAPANRAQVKLKIVIRKRRCRKSREWRIQCKLVESLRMALAASNRRRNKQENRWRRKLEEELKILRFSLSTLALGVFWMCSRKPFMQITENSLHAASSSSSFALLLFVLSTLCKCRSTWMWESCEAS